MVKREFIKDLAIKKLGLNLVIDLAIHKDIPNFIDSTSAIFIDYINFS